MKTCVSFICLCLLGLALSAPVSAEQSTPEAVIEPASSSFPLSEPCPVPAQDRTVNICTPPDGVFLTSPFLLRAKVADAAGLHGMALYINGKFQGSAESIPPDVTIRQISVSRYLPHYAAGQGCCRIFPKDHTYQREWRITLHAKYDQQNRPHLLARAQRDGLLPSSHFRCGD
jgi:hypothetical protein